MDTRIQGLAPTFVVPPKEYKEYYVVPSKGVTTPEQIVADLTEKAQKTFSSIMMDMIQKVTARSAVVATKNVTTIPSDESGAVTVAAFRNDTEVEDKTFGSLESAFDHLIPLANKRIEELKNTILFKRYERSFLKYLVDGHVPSKLSLSYWTGYDVPFGTKHAFENLTTVLDAKKAALGIKDCDRPQGAETLAVSPNSPQAECIRILEKIAVLKERILASQYALRDVCVGEYQNHSLKSGIENAQRAKLAEISRAIEVMKKELPQQALTEKEVSQQPVNFTSLLATIEQKKREVEGLMPVASKNGEKRASCTLELSETTKKATDLLTEIVGIKERVQEEKAWMRAVPVDIQKGTYWDQRAINQVLNVKKTSVEKEASEYIVTLDKEIHTLGKFLTETAGQALSLDKAFDSYKQTVGARKMHPALATATA